MRHFHIELGAAQSEANAFETRDGRLPRSTRGSLGGSKSNFSLRKIHEFDVFYTFG